MLDGINGDTLSWTHKTHDGKDGANISSAEEFFADGGGPIYLKQRNMAFVNIENNVTRTYDGTQITPVVTWGVGASAEQLIKGVHYTVTFTGASTPAGAGLASALPAAAIANAGTTAGSGTFVLTGIGNYTGTTSAAFVINPAVPTIEFPAAAAVTFEAALNTSALTGGSTGFGSFVWQDGTVIPTVTNSGYNVEFTPSDTDNYDYTAVDGWSVNTGKVVRIVNITVNRAVQDKPDTSKIFGDSSKISSGVPGISVEVDGGGRVSYKLDTGTNLEYSIDGGITWITGLDLGSLQSNREYIILVRAKETENFQASEPHEIRFRTMTAVSIKESDRTIPKGWFDRQNDGTGGEMSEIGYGVFLHKKVVSGKAGFTVVTPGKVNANIVIYDNLGNIVFNAQNVKSGEPVSWNLTNRSGRAVGGGPYLITAFARDVNGKTHRYSGRVYVRR